MAMQTTQVTQSATGTDSSTTALVRWAAGLLVVLCVAYAVEPLLVGLTARPVGPLVLALAGVALLVFCLALARVVWRGRHEGRPWTLVLAAVLGIGLFIQFGPDLVTLPALAAGAAGFLLSRMRAVALVVMTIALLVLLLVQRGLPAAVVGELTGRAVLLMVVVGAAGSLVELTRQVQRHRGERERLVVAEERLRIARDLHDMLGQNLAAISMRGQAAARMLDRDPDRARDEVDSLVELAASSVTDMRGLVEGYRRRSLRQEVDGARSVLAAAGIDVEVGPLPESVPEAATDALGWVTREATTNVLRHSHATRCSIRFDAHPDTVGVEIVNDRPFRDGSGPGRGNGLPGLAERLARIGGSLDAGPSSETEFRLRATVPRTETQT